MTNLTISIDKLVDDGIKSGNFKSNDDAIMQLLTILVEKDIDNNIKKGLQQIKDGKGIEVNNEYRKNLQNRIFNRLSIAN